MKACVPSLLLLVACGQASNSPTGDDASTAAPTAKAIGSTSTPFVQDEKNELVEFHYAWSAEAAAVPQLVDRFRNDMEMVRAELIAGAKEDKAAREKQGYDFHGHSSNIDYRTSGQSARLLSLAVDASAYTGGAHGNHGTNGLLWDRRAAREIKVADLFASPANMNRLLTQRWCDALNRAREEKRGVPVGGDPLFDDCPGLDQIAIIPTDNDRNGRFELLLLVASPYVAGPYAEGSYEIEIGIAPELIAALKADYRPSFEAQTQ